MREQQSSDAPESSAPIPAAEWAVAAVGLIVFLVAMSSLVHQTFWRGNSPPDIHIAIRSTRAQANGYLVEITVRNRGEETAASLVVEGTVRPGTDGEERSELTLDYLAGGSERSAGLFFKSDPRNAGLEIRPLGYNKP